MAAMHPHPTHPLALPANSPRQQDDWEDWEEEEDNDNKTSLRDSPRPHPSTALAQEDVTTLRNPQHRYSVQRPSRIKSKGRQKAQNARAGIKLVTDMSKFRRPAATGPKSAGPSAREDKRGKFSDAAALRALEGEPTSASIGSFSWLKKKQGYSRFNKSAKKHTRGPSVDLSPAERPIVIGISVPEDNLSSHQVSPWTAILETPVNMPSDDHTSSPQQLRSVWSPDTEASVSPRSGLRHTCSIYATANFRSGRTNPSEVPAIPALPATQRLKQTAGVVQNDEEDLDTPCTLFEEDGSPSATRKSLKPPMAIVTPDSATSRSHGWWDHITTPFSAKSNPFSARQAHDATSASSPTDEWWKRSNEKSAVSPVASGSRVVLAVAGGNQQLENNSHAPRDIDTSRQMGSRQGKCEGVTEDIPNAAELPPPYSPPKEQVKYGAVLPPLQLFPQQGRLPSPRPMTPNLPGTMTSQGSVMLADVPLTPAVHGSAPLPDRAAGSYATGDHFLAARGRDNKTERQRRRHEKEDVVARRIGGFWRGRGCMPENGCMGRGGREGRKRRRVCLGIIGVVLALIILAIVLAVVLTRQAVTVDPQEPASVFLNLTNFPPMPTGVLTMSGPDNTVAFSDCMYQGTPKTSWSCSLPKEEHAFVAPFAPNQPEFVFQIQFDNHTQASWDVPDGADPVTKGFSPSPAPPKFKDMDFLGNTTDNIVVDAKAGEATPFYISLLTSVNDTVGSNALSRRQGFNNQIGSGGDNGTTDFNIADQLPRPKLKADGTIAPAQLFPRPVQQPIRLFDRGLPTEHYGFYTYFNKTIFIHDKENISPVDRDGGSPLEDARVLMVFGQARFRVQIWTRRENNTQLLGNGTAPGTEGTSIFSKPGTMPYPVTVTEDMHGGNPNQKIDYYWGLTEDKHVNTTDAKLIVADRGFGGGLVNPMAQRDPALGGIDGGTGGCRCEWVNFQGLRKF